MFRIRRDLIRPKTVADISVRGNFLRPFNKLKPSELRSQRSDTHRAGIQSPGMSVRITFLLSMVDLIPSFFIHLTTAAASLKLQSYPRTGWLAFIQTPDSQISSPDCHPALTEEAELDFMGHHISNIHISLGQPSNLSQIPDETDMIPGLSFHLRGRDAALDPHHSRLGRDSLPLDMTDIIPELSLHARSIEPGSASRRFAQVTQHAQTLRDWDFTDMIPGLSFHARDAEPDSADRRISQIPRLGPHSQEVVAPEMAHIAPKQPLHWHSGYHEEIWCTEMLISEEELRYAIDVLLQQPVEDVDKNVRILRYIFYVVLPHASRSREIYHTSKHGQAASHESILVFKGIRLFIADHYANLATSPAFPCSSATELFDSSTNGVVYVSGGAHLDGGLGPSAAFVRVRQSKTCSALYLDSTKSSEVHFYKSLKDGERKYSHYYQ
ncbi:hypothetical protein B0H13DRAFT_1899552 [Mycena leptocephala]|nr:hypothetical protein B0H13DRAFT_1899552 [Mycena leptocephala]